MDNTLDNLLDTYLFETNSLLEQLDELLINAEKNADFTSDDVNEIFRIMHTIKGSSAMLEFSSLMTIAHHIEDVFFFIRENGISSLSSSHKSELFNLMFKSTDKLREEVRKVEKNEPLSTNIDSIIQEINSFLDKISKDGGGKKASAAPQAAAPAPSPAVQSRNGASLPPDPGICFLRVFFDEGCGMENLRAFMLVTSLKDAITDFRFYPADIENNSGTAELIIRDGFFLAFDAKEMAETAIAVIKDINNLHSYELLDNPEYREPETRQATASGTAPDTPKASPAQKAAPGAAHNAPVKQNLISVNLTKLDMLMAVVGEIVITESMVISSPELHGLKLDSFLKSARQLRKLTDDLQDIAMSLRMVPISGTFQKMNRIVRDMKQELNKDVRLTIEGENTEVDKSIVDNISDPIMHIVRNAMDHGIEKAADDRVRAGKNPQGEIVLAARHTGSEVIITITDDGRGIDPASVLAKARENGLLVKPEEEYSQKEILSLLMLPGFSTNKEVTEYSGRGVGMDVVKRNVEAIGGTVGISSEYGKGTCMTLRIPLTLAIVDGMEVSVGGTIFTIPISNIRKSFKALPEDIIYDSEGHELIRCMGDFYPLVRLHQLYGIDSAITGITEGLLMWVEASDKSYCLFIDELLGEQQVVVKPLPSYLNNFNIKNSGISGCTILGDGNTSIILEISNVYQATRALF
ncbi:MAG: ATP-binding protein [Eisenbergiella sp.]